MKLILFIREHLKKIIIALVIVVAVIIIYVVGRESIEFISKLWNTKDCSQATQCICKQNEQYCDCINSRDNTSEILCSNRTIPYKATNNNCNLAIECLCKKNDETCDCYFSNYNFRKDITCPNNQF